MIKPRNVVVQALRTPSGPYIQKVVKSKKLYNRKESNKITLEDEKKQ